ncbi:MAG TPA: protein-export chaperone SecB [Chthoniobacter sp.]|jgi:preprotein translocase subunit SecB
MKAALIELTNYFVSEMQFTANRGFDPQKQSCVGVDDLQVTNQATPKSDNRRDWQITLRIALNAPPDRNSPYSFLVEIIGFVHVSDGVKDENIDRMTCITGTSLVFSAAREIIRAVTSRGPYQPILLPTVTFWEPKPAPPPGEAVAELAPSPERVALEDVQAENSTSKEQM